MLRRALLPTLLIGLLATALVGCGDDEPSGPPTGTGEIAGTVTVDGQPPQSSVTAILDDGERQTSTNTFGSFTFEEVEVGIHTVAIEPPADATCEITEQEVGVAVDETTSITFECTGGGGGGRGSRRSVRRLSGAGCLRLADAWQQAPGSWRTNCRCLRGPRPASLPSVSFRGPQP
jgi:hypothetical protein